MADYQEDPYQHISQIEIFDMPAIHFNGATLFRNGQLAAGNDGVLSVSVWFRVSEGVSSDYRPNLFISSPELTGEVDDPERSNLLLFLNNSVVGLHSHGRDVPDDLPAAAIQIFSSREYAPGSWHHILACIRQDASGPDRPARLYVDDIDVTINDPEFGENTAPFTMSLSGRSFCIGSDGLEPETPLWFRGDMAELWIASGQNILSGNDIPEDTRRKFISAAGRPVPLGTNGELPTGTAPTIFGHGDKNTFLQPNLGTGGGFALIGSISDSVTPPRLG